MEYFIQQLVNGITLGSIEKDGKIVLVHPSQKTENGLDIA
tara:strand:+ start:3141 stop:3260 length:120 start_codon:yes stop_codon:yes gene_type:complete